MRTTQQLQDLGQSIWLDNITRPLLNSGGLRRYIDEFSVTGLTSNPTIFDHAIGNTDAYDDSIHEKAQAGQRGERLFVELALEDLRRAADLFRPAYDASDGIDGWVSMELSPLLANDTAHSIEAAARIYRQADRRNLFVKIPGTPEGVPAIEESIFAGVPINVTLLFSREQYVASAEAYLRGIERRLAARLSPRVASVASLFVSRWDKAVSDTVPADLRNRLGISIAARTSRFIASCWRLRAGVRSRLQVRVLSVCSGRVPERRIPRHPKRCTSKRWPRRTRSTPYPRRRYTRSRSTASSRTRWPKTAVTQKPCSHALRRRALMSTHSRNSCSATAQGPS